MTVSNPDSCADGLSSPGLKGPALDIHFGPNFFTASEDGIRRGVETRALGIGMNSMMFSVIHARLLEPPPYKNVERLVMISNMTANQNQGPVATGDFLDWRKQARSFEQIGLCGFGASQVTMAESGPPERIRWEPVTANFFDLLGVNPALGRSFSEQEASSGVFDVDHARRAVILSHEFWQRRFGGDPGVLGRRLRINGQAATVIGFMPQGFRILSWGDQAEMW